MPRAGFNSAFIAAARAIALAVCCVLPTVAMAAEGGAGATEQQAEARRFDIWEFRVEGNTLLDVARIEAAVSPYLGPQRSIDDVQAASGELERAYRSAGYPVIFIEIPEQDVVGGVITLRAVEGKIDRVRVTQSRYFTLSGIRGAVPSVDSGRALHVPSMQAELNALNARSSNLKVAPILSPGKTPGTVDIELKVKDALPLSGAIELNNYHSETTTDTRLGVSLSYDNLWQKQHSFALQYQVSPEATDEVSVLVGTYLMALPDSSNRLAFYAIDSKSDVASVGDTSVLGDGNIYGVRFVKPLVSDPANIRSLTLGFDYKDFNEIIRLDPTTSDVTPISYGMWTTQYALLMPSKKSQSKFNIGANFGIRSLFNDDSQFAFKRYGGKPNFAYLAAAFDRTDFLAGDWQVRSALDMQIANSPLINNEQFSAGGATSVRGYYQSQRLGDNGARLSLELATPTLAKWGDTLSELRLISFVEGAYLTVVDALPGQDDEFDLLSAGLGLRLKSPLGLDLNVDWGYPLRDSGSVQEGDSQTHVGMKFVF